MKSYSSREVIRILEADDWCLIRIKGSHHQFKHPRKKGITSVPHPRKDINPNTIRSIQQQSGINFE